MECSGCSQCIAVCAEKALSWNGVLPIGYDSTLLPSAAQLDELFKERRTVRDFRAESIDRVMLEEIVSYGAFAPTHNFNMPCIIVDDPRLIEVFDGATFEFSKRIYGLIFRARLIRALVTLAPRPAREKFARGKPKLEAVIARGKGYQSRPAAIMCIVSDGRVPLSLESAQYALYTMSLYAQVKGLGCRNLVGNQMIVSVNGTARWFPALGRRLSRG
jgi:nitroreductase